MSEFRMLPAGEQGLVVEFGDSVDAAINARVHQIARRLLKRLPGKLLEVVPTYRSFMVYFNPLLISREEIAAVVEETIAAVGPGVNQNIDARVVHIPVCYGGEYGPDLQYVARHNRLTSDEVIQIHTSTPYLVYMLGFTPGFPYLGGMSERIATPRLEQPRTAIPAGSVGIAGNQTGFYPVESPGGWQLIGRTPVKAFHPQSSNPFLFDAGDYLQFIAITPSEYLEIQQRVQSGNYIPATSALHRGDDQP
jgi:inhibitor of KinA